MPSLTSGDCRCRLVALCPGVAQPSLSCRRFPCDLADHKRRLRVLNLMENFVWILVSASFEHIFDEINIKLRNWCVGNLVFSLSCFSFCKLGFSFRLIVDPCDYTCFEQSKTVLEREHIDMRSLLG